MGLQCKLTYMLLISQFSLSCFSLIRRKISLSFLLFIAANTFVVVHSKTFHNFRAQGVKAMVYFPYFESQWASHRSLLRSASHTDLVLVCKGGHQVDFSFSYFAHPLNPTFERCISIVQCWSPALLCWQICSLLRSLL